LARSTDISMFDCPEQRKTSPLSTSLTVCVVPELPFAVSTKGPPAPIAGKVTVQCPAESARALADATGVAALPADPDSAAASETGTRSPPTASPQTATGLSRCNTT